MKLIESIKAEGRRTVWLRAFHIWQLRPHQVAPMNEEERICSSCGTHYMGNYCPRCGQSAIVGRFSFKKATLLFLDVWGLGNRGMFRSIRDLMLRPGYMIRDYISGMQSAYFPPFKMFFLLATFSLLVEHGFSLGLEEENASTNELPKIEKTEEVKQQAGKQGETVTVNGEEMDYPLVYIALKFTKKMDKLRQKNPAIFSFIFLVLFSAPLFFFIRHNPNIPDRRYSEFIVALVYISNMYSLYSIAGTLLNSKLLKLIAFLMIFVAFHQFSGFRKRRVFRYLFLTALISFVVWAAIIALALYIDYLFI